jgi:hypothetical protein
MVAILYINGMVETKQYGVHGYTFTPENIGKKFRDKPNNKVFITEYGYVEQHILNMLKLETLIPYSYIEDFCTAVDSGINALDAVLVSTVSRLIELGVNRVRVINKHLEISIDNYQNDTIKKTLVETYAKLKEHDIILEYCDDLIKTNSVGMEIAKENAIINADSPFDLDIIHTINNNKYWTVDKPSNIFLDVSTLKYNKDNKKGDEKKVVIGKRGGNILYGYSSIKNDNVILNHILKFYLENIGANNIASMVDIKNIYDTYILSRLLIYGEKYLTIDKHMNVTTITGIPLCGPMNPVTMGSIVNVNFDTMKILYKAGVENDSNEYTQTVIDVTEQFFPGGKWNPDFDNGCNLNIDYYGRELKINLLYGTDILPRNNIRKIMNVKPVIKLIIEPIEKNMIRFYTYMESGSSNEKGIWCNFYANLLII